MITIKKYILLLIIIGTTLGFSREPNPNEQVYDIITVNGEQVLKLVDTEDMKIASTNELPTTSISSATTNSISNEQVSLNKEEIEQVKEMIPGEVKNDLIPTDTSTTNDNTNTPTSSNINITGNAIATPSNTVTIVNILVDILYATIALLILILYMYITTKYSDKYPWLKNLNILNIINMLMSTKTQVKEKTEEYIREKNIRIEILEKIDPNIIKEYGDKLENITIEELDKKIKELEHLQKQ